MVTACNDSNRINVLGDAIRRLPCPRDLNNNSIGPITANLNI